MAVFSHILWHNIHFSSMVTHFLLLIEDKLFETQSYMSGLPLDHKFLEEMDSFVSDI